MRFGHSLDIVMQLKKEWVRLHLSPFGMIVLQLEWICGKIGWCFSRKTWFHLISISLVRNFNPYRLTHLRQRAIFLVWTNRIYYKSRLTGVGSSSLSMILELALALLETYVAYTYVDIIETFFSLFWAFRHFYFYDKALNPNFLCFNPISIHILIK